MTKLYKLLLGFGALMGILCPFQSKATHLMGADMTWKCLGNDTFLIIATVYRDCNGIQLSNTPISFYGECGGFAFPQNLAGSLTGGRDITPTCKKLPCTRCSDIGCTYTAFGIQQWTISAKVVFPKGCCHWKVSWNQNARNNAINTVDNAGIYTLYTEAEINTCLKNPCDNSPYFTIPPVAIFCVNQCITLNPGANDDDRDVNGQADSLVYSFGEPLQGEGSTIPYTPPYNYKIPLDYTGTDPDAAFTPPLCAGFHLDSATGDIQFRATKINQNTIMVILVDEYRKDSLGIMRKIGTTRRDIEISIVDCGANHAPVITGINGGTSNTIKICAEQQTCFTIRSFDIDPKDSVTMTWNNAIKGASFNIADKSKKWPVGVFCWRPTEADVRTFPYHFIVTAVDDFCDIPGRGSRAFTIYVLPAPKAAYFTKKSACGHVYFQADPSGDSKVSISDYVWTGQGAPGYAPLFIHSKTGNHQYERAGTYHYTLTVTSANGCSRSYNDSVKIDPFVQISLPKDSSVCEKAAPITIKAEHRLGNAPYAISWNTGEKTDQITKKITKDTVFVAYIKDGNNCTNYDSMRIKMQPLPKPKLGPDQRGCSGHSIMLTTGLKSQSAVWSRISGKDTLRHYLRGDTIQVIDSGLYVVAVRDSIGCDGADSVNVYFNPPVKVTPLDTNVCQNDSVHLDAGKAGPGAKYTWIDVIHGRVVGTGPYYTVPSATNTTAGYHFRVIITQTRDGVTCTDTNYKNVVVHKHPVPKLTSPPAQCVDNPPFSLVQYSDAAHRGGRWFYPPNPAAIVGTYLYPAIMKATDTSATLGYVHYYYVDPYKCAGEDSMKVSISNLPKVNAGADTVICKANGRYVLNKNYKVSPASGGVWYAAKGTPPAAVVSSTFGDSIFFDPAKVGVDTDYYVIYSYTAVGGNARCDNSDTVKISVKTNPTISITPVDSLCDNGDQVQLYAQPPGGTWAIADSTPAKALVYDAGSGGYSFDPVAAGGGSHLLYYTGYADPHRKLCSTLDSTRVYVVPKPANVDFSTEDHLWRYCINHAAVRLVPTVPGGGFSGRGVYSLGGSYYFNPASADSIDDSKNVITYILPYNKGKCRVTISHKITIDGRPFVSIKTGSALCEGSTTFEITAETNNTTNLEWASDNGNVNFVKKSQNGNMITMTFFPSQKQLKAGSFNVFLTGRNNGKCDSSTDTRFYTINPRPVVDFKSDQEACEPFTVKFTPIVLLSKGTIQSYEWDFGDGSPHSADASPVHTYRVINGQNRQQFDVKLSVTSSFGCVGDTVKRRWITVNATPVPLISAKPQFTTIAQPKIQFSISDRSRNIDFNDPKTSFSWTFGDINNSGNNGGHSNERNPVYTYGDTGKYTVVLKVNSKGCEGLDSEVNFIDIRPELIIFIPNVFKPDSFHGGNRHDNYFSAWENETFQPVISGYATFDMNIFNRWGQLVYNTTDPLKGWNGKYLGGEAQEGVYVYVIKATSFSGKPYTFTGSVTLIK